LPVPRVKVFYWLPFSFTGVPTPQEQSARSFSPLPFPIPVHSLAWLAFSTLFEAVPGKGQVPDPPHCDQGFFSEFPHQGFDEILTSLRVFVRFFSRSSAPLTLINFCTQLIFYFPIISDGFFVAPIPSFFLNRVEPVPFSPHLFFFSPPPLKLPVKVGRVVKVSQPPSTRSFFNRRLSSPFADIKDYRTMPLFLFHPFCRFLPFFLLVLLLCRHLLCQMHSDRFGNDLFAPSVAFTSHVLVHLLNLL